MADAARPAPDPLAHDADWARAWRTLARSGLFLADHYAGAGSGAGGDGADPLASFCRGGWRDGRNPNPYFDCAYYLAHNPDVRMAGINPLLHYLLDGDREARRPIGFFDPAWYRRNHAVPPTQTCLAHYLAHRHTGLASPVAGFDPVRHLRLHPQAAAACADPFLHAQAHPSGAPDEAQVIAASFLFDASFYLIGNPDVRDTRLDPLVHFCRHGAREGRNPNLYFDTAWYAARHGLAQDGGNPLCHYYLQGEPAGLPPGPHFDPLWYARVHGLAAWQSALRHYLENRRGQRVSPNPDFDLDAYLAQVPGRPGPNRDAYADWLRRGRPAIPARRVAPPPCLRRSARWTVAWPICGRASPARPGAGWNARVAWNPGTRRRRWRWATR